MARDTETVVDRSRSLRCALGDNGVIARAATVILHLAVVATGGLGILAQAAVAASFPERTVHFVVGFSAGGGTDVLARLIAKELTTKWGQAVVVDNRTGADGAIAAEQIAEGPADGYQLAIITNGHTIAPAQRPVPYDPLNSFAPITEIANSPDFLVVHPGVPAKSMAELIALAKAKPGSITFGSSGTGTVTYLAGELFAQMAGINIVHAPYKGSSQAVIGILGGEVQMMFGAVPTTRAQIKSGGIWVLAISSKQRWAQEPDVPTVAESGLPGFEAGTWYGILAHAKTPPDIVAKLNTDIVQVIRSPAITEFITQDGFEPIANSSEQFHDVIATDLKKWAEVMKGKQK